MAPAGPAPTTQTSARGSGVRSATVGTSVLVARLGGRIARLG
ncbi:MAG: hypothetical protein J07HB67_02811, partial [halophilic archaeon J07HB67]